MLNPLQSLMLGLALVPLLVHASQFLKTASAFLFGYQRQKVGKL